ncbi:hypothetical protein BDP55DRAFT_639195 [Colletotrichum godetiae]|uniref:Uncharacterized protein n=1 Tax=Colletotrichum godetiae TaxID=1209918 RepID=A0AAJ0A9E5_9PEZI|nr:uncharacterized protein BDP55DRAFT_639195 [Colletotrichum godetiae]KAK1656935.1 hypothetical protein BDP55DRAFT_639195 [Colletotrichum godetiae]
MFDQQQSDEAFQQDTSIAYIVEQKKPTGQLDESRVCNQVSFSQGRNVLAQLGDGAHSFPFYQPIWSSSTPIHQLLLMEQSSFIIADGRPEVAHEWACTNRQFKDSVNTILRASSLASCSRGQGPVLQSAERSGGLRTEDGSEPNEAGADDEESQAALRLQTLGQVAERG